MARGGLALAVAARGHEGPTLTVQPQGGPHLSMGGLALATPISPVY